MTKSNLLGHGSIRHLIDSCSAAIEIAPVVQIVGGNGQDWYQQVGHDHDFHANRSSLEELRNQIRSRIVNLSKSPGALRQRGLLRKLELSVVRSNKALFDTAKLIGVKPSDGLYKRIKVILVEAENLDPESELWLLLGVDP